MVSVSAECWPLHRPRHLPIVGRYANHHSADMLVDTSVDMLTDTSWLTYRLTPDRYVDRHCRPIHQLSVSWYVARDVDRYIGWGVYKIHMIRFLYSLHMFVWHWIYVWYLVGIEGSIFFYYFWLLKSSPITKVVLISKLQFDWIWFTNLISRVSLPPTPWKEVTPWEQGWDLYRKVVN